MSNPDVFAWPLRRRDIDWVRATIDANPAWSRARIAIELCAAWDWRDGKGRAKTFAARSLLLKLEARSEVKLPALRGTYRRKQWQWMPKPAGVAAPMTPIESTLREAGPIAIEPVDAGTVACGRWSAHLAQHHYLGLRLVGENLGYLVRSRDGRDLACLLFGAPAWKCAPRDAYLEWSPRERAKELRHVANNTRFLILPWVKIPHLASHVLAAVARRIDADWRAKYGHGLKWLETFVERDRFRGTCYRAANWKLGLPRKSRHQIRRL